MTKTLFCITCSWCFINPKVHRMVCVLQSGTDLRWWMNRWATIVGFHPSNLFTWHTMWRSTNVDFYPLIKKHLGRGNFLLFSKLFARFGDRFLPLSLYIHCTVLHFTYYYILHFLLFVSKWSMKFCPRNFLLMIVSHDHWTENLKNVSVVTARALQ